MLVGMRALICIACLLAVSGPLAQTVYKNVLPDGSVVYSDQRTEGAEPLELPEIQIYSAPSLQTDSDRAAASARSGQPGMAEEEGDGYRRFAIANPGHDEPVRDNGGNVSVSLTLEPSLRPGHVIDIRMDGQSIGRGSGTSVALTNVDRGSHTVQAVVVDENGTEVARTESVTFHLLRASAL